ncbi:TonB-dependent receptor plug domain-containing protein [Polaribacter sp. IC073]|uniref:TonB-dependent receptor plug domain-containing protein n=1 Tax=Polaribacter sp. IC073 TaxID=2508540 RepID=UPI0011BD8138|nr:TonB-dependent receptor plug domain-containing protein [Polaribacter sp. IC073]TXD46665.1 hypothetical protein ES045_14110 [Polaribacter sp. IC073]
MKNILKVMLVLFTVTAASSSFAQKKVKIKISGFVKDSLNRPIEDCVIFIDNKKQNKQTNRKGYYSLKLRKTPKVITFYAPNYGLTEVDYNNSRNIDVTFNKMSSKLKVKFAALNKEEKENPNRFRYANIYAYLRGRVSGVQVFPNNTIIIRGTSSLLGSSEPLFVLNNAVISKNNIESINPSDIKSVRVLKGSEASLYGVRGAAGVIKITTY